MGNEKTKRGRQQDKKRIAAKQPWEVAPVVTKFRKMGYSTVHADDVRTLAKEFNNMRDRVEAAIVERFSKVDDTKIAGDGNL